jgi:hypothetical protein
MNRRRTLSSYVASFMLMFGSKHEVLEAMSIANSGRATEYLCCTNNVATSQCWRTKISSRAYFESIPTLRRLVASNYGDG